LQYKWSEIPALLSTPLGRFHLMHGIYRNTWPILSRIAYLYRSTLVRNTRIIAVVGSYGKSTTTRALISALGKQYHPSFQRNSWTGIARGILRIRPFDRHAAIEVGIHGRGEMDIYARLIRPDITVVTSIGSEHNRSLGTLETTRSEKSAMVKSLRESGLAVLNGDDPNVLWMKSQTSARVITFGIGETNDIIARDIKLDWPNGMRLKLHAGGETRALSTRLIGKHMVYPVLATIAVAIAEGLDLDQVIRALESLPPTSGRLQPVELANGAFILRDDHKSGLETVEAALDALSEIPAKRRIVVLGEIEEPPGSQGPIYRAIGERIAEIAWQAIFLGGDTGCKSYAVGAKRGGLPPERIINAGRDIFKAIEALRETLIPGDVVLIKGRDTQRLERVAFSLMALPVRCDISFCNAKVNCEHCPMLERGWRGQNAVM